MHYGCGAWDDPVVGDPGARETGEGTPRIEGLSFSSITASGARLAAAWIDGLAESPVRGLSFHDVAISLDGEVEAAPAEMSAGAPRLSHAGFRAANVVGLRLSNLRISGQSGPAYVLRSCVGLKHSFCSPVPRWPGARFPRG
jgi:hypothetical protein